MLLGARQFFERRGAPPTPPLPYDAEVEYLESTGTQWIDTGVKCASDCGFSIVGEMLVVTSDESYPVMAGAQFSDWSDWLTIYEGSGSVAVGDDYSIINCRVNEVISAYLNYMDDGKITVETPAPYRSISYTSTNINANICIFAAGSDDGIACLSKSRVYSMKVSEGQNVVRDFIPVRFTNEGVSEGAMYDRVSGALFRNAGTGAFVIGADKTVPTARDYVQTGLVAMWDGIENAGWGVHDPNATVWKDLSATGNDATLSQWATWSGDSLVTDGTHYAALADADKLSGVRFAEIAYRRTLTRYGYVGLFAVKKIGPSDNASSLMMAFRSSAFMAGDHGCLIIDGEYRNAAINNVPLSGTIGVDYYVPKIYIDSSEGEIVAGGEAWSQTTVGEIGGRYARTGNVYNGEICSIRIYNRALTAAEIAANYAIDKQRFNLP